MDPASARYIPNKKRELDISGSEVKEDSTFNFARQYFTGDMDAIAEDVMRAKEVSVTVRSLFDSGDKPPINLEERGGTPVRGGPPARAVRGEVCVRGGVRVRGESQVLSDDIPDHGNHTPQSCMDPKQLPAQ
ncbi:hypothetical protein SCUP234_03235 [Seiridium cupressi]